MDLVQTASHDLIASSEIKLNELVTKREAQEKTLAKVLHMSKMLTTKKKNN